MLLSGSSESSVGKAGGLGNQPTAKSPSPSFSSVPSEQKKKIADNAEKPCSPPEPPCPSLKVVNSEQKKKIDEKYLKNLSGQETLDHYREGEFEDLDLDFCIMCNYGKINIYRFLF